MGEFHSKVAGVSAKNPDGTDRQSLIKAFVKSNMPLILISEPDNEFDPNAIAVFVKVRAFIFFSSVVQIGYLNKEVAKELSQHKAKGGIVTGKVTAVTGGKGRDHAGVNILLTKIKR